MRVRWGEGKLGASFTLAATPGDALTQSLLRSSSPPAVPALYAGS